jgi:hypothetical protein
VGDQTEEQQMPRYYFHLHARSGERVVPDPYGQHIPDPEEVWAAAQRMARWLIDQNMQPVQWGDYRFEVMDEAGEIVFKLPLRLAKPTNDSHSQAWPVQATRPRIASRYGARLFRLQG